MIQPELELDHGERAHLHALTVMEGYKLLHRIMRAEVDKFMVKLINEEPKDARAVVAAHLLAKAAAQFYAQVTNRINEEVVQYVAAPKSTDKPLDVTDGVLDLGGLAADLEDIPNLLGGEEVE